MGVFGGGGGGCSIWCGGIGGSGLSWIFVTLLVDAVMLPRDDEGVLCDDDDGAFDDDVLMGCGRLTMYVRSVGYFDLSSL